MFQVFFLRPDPMAIWLPRSTMLRLQRRVEGGIRQVWFWGEWRYYLPRLPLEVRPTAA